MTNVHIIYHALRRRNSPTGVGPEHARCSRCSCSMRPTARHLLYLRPGFFTPPPFPPIALSGATPALRTTYLQKHEVVDLDASPPHPAAAPPVRRRQQNAL